MRVSRRAFVVGGAASASIGFSTAVEAIAAGAAPGVLKRRIDDYLQRLSGFGYSGATLLVRNGETILRQGYGIANEADHLAVAPDTLFDIGSLAKTFTAAAILLLVERGELRLEESLAKHLEAVPADKQGITVEQLLSHTAGLDSEFPIENPISESYEEVSREEALKRILATELIDQPGNRFKYSNMGFMLLAMIAESAGKRPFRDFVRSEIFSPLKLTSTDFWGEGLNRFPDRRLARSYDESGETENLRKRSGTTWVDFGAGEMVSTVDDLYRWMQAMRQDTLLSSATRQRMWTPGKGECGFCWFIEKDGPGGRRIHHGGDAVGFCAELAYYPDHGLVLANLANRRYQVLSTRYAADRVLPQIALGQAPLQMWPGRKFDQPPRWLAASGPLESAIGTYELASGGRIVISRKADGHFWVGGRGQDAVDVLSPASDQERRVRVRSNERARALLNAAIAGDLDAMKTVLREGAPLEAYRNGLSRTVAGDKVGRLLETELIGTAPYGFPFGGRETLFHFRFEKGDDYLRLGWDARQDRVINMGGGTRLLGSAPLRASPDGAIVGWNVTTGRSLRITPETMSGKVVGIQIETTDGIRSLARRS